MNNNLKLFDTIPYTLAGLLEPLYTNEVLEKEISKAYENTEDMMKDLVSVEHDAINKTVYIFTRNTEKDVISIRKPLMGLNFSFLIV